MCVLLYSLALAPEGFVSPSCKTDIVPLNENHGRIECPVYRHKTSITTGTIFDKTPTVLITWFEATWQVTYTKYLMSAKALEGTLGVNYRVA